MPNKKKEGNKNVKLINQGKELRMMKHCIRRLGRKKGSDTPKEKKRKSLSDF